MTPDRPQPDVRVVKGELTDEELGALVIVLRARSAARELGSAATGARGWTDRARLMRRYTRAGAGAWRASAWVER